MLTRALQAAQLRGALYRQLTDEPQEIFYALGIVALSGLALGLGLQSNPPVTLESAPPWMVIVFSAYTRLMGWFLYAGIVYLVGSKILGGNAGFRHLLRGLGLTFGPGVLAVFGGIPVVGVAFIAVSALWIFPAALIAIKETQGFDWVRAFICAALGWIVSIFVLQVLLLPIAAPAP